MPGSVRRRGHRWQASVEVPRRNGKRGRIYRSFKSEREGTLWIADRHLSVANGTFVPPSAMTLSEALEEWFSSARSSASTRRINRSFAQRLVNEFGGLALQSISLPMLERYVARLSDAVRLDGRPGGLSDTTIDHHVRILKSFFKWAKARGLIARDAALAIPRIRPQPGQGMAILTVAELKTILHVAEGTEMEAPIAFAGLAGLRRGEAIGVGWQDVDLERGIVRVERSISQTPQGPKVGPPKTKSSRRTLMLSSDAIHLLTRVRNRKVAELGSVPEFVCTLRNGHRWSPGYFGDRFRDFLVKNNFRHMRFHDLRHTHASHLIAAGVHIKVISSRLGHKNIQITMDLYGHLIPGVEDSAIVQLQALFEAA